MTLKTPTPVKTDNSDGSGQDLDIEQTVTGSSKTPFAVREPNSNFNPNLKEIWNFYELLYFLVWRDIKVRYKQTVLGVTWAVVQPFMTMIVFAIFFGKLAQISTDGFPGPIFYFSGLLPWQLFAYALTNSSNSLVSNRDLVTKVYFPRLIIPLSSTIAGIVDFFIAFLVLIAMMFFYGIVPTWSMLLLPVFILFTIATALAVSLWLSALNVKYRDVRFTIPFLTQFWLFITPIAYPSSLVPEKWRFIYGLNPMAGVVEGFRWAILGKSSGTGSLMIASAVIVVILLIGGLIYFRYTERTFADVI